MNKDVDERLLPPGQYKHAENIIISNSEGDDAGTARNPYSTKQLTNIDFGANAKGISFVVDNYKNRIFWFVKSDNGCYINVWEKDSNTFSTILTDTRVGDLNVLGFDTLELITGIDVIIDSDTGSTFLTWTCMQRGPRIINVERAQTWAVNGFDDDDISVIKAPPLYPPQITLTDTLSGDENNIEELFLRIGYRYQYLDGEFSAPSPLTETAFFPKQFSYSFSTSINKSMVNNFNQVGITFNTGSKNVKSVEILFKESGSNNLSVVQTFDKEKENWPDNTEQSINFDNNKVYRILPEEQLSRLYDNVPRFAKALSILGNRIFYGNYVENYNLINADGTPTLIDHSIELVETEILNNLPKPSLKSNRDYEICRAYIDDKGRMTTALDSKNNTVYVPNQNCVLQNRIKVTVPNKAPAFAKHYRFLIKESKFGYETVIPTLFFIDGNFIYFYVQASDVDKIGVNDFLNVKADTESVKDSIVKIKVLEVEQKEKNFINEVNGGQPEGFYIKSSIQNENLIFDENSYSYYRFDHYDQSENGDIINNEQTDYVKTLFKGDTLDDLTPSANYTEAVDVRYEIEIFDISGPADTFRFRTQQTDGTLSSWDENTAGGGLGYEITGLLQAVDANLDVTFGAVTGHSLNDKWLVKVNRSWAADEDNYAYAKFSYPDNITIGSIITLKYYMKRERDDNNISQFLLTFISNGDYENLEEWYYGDEIYNQLQAEPNFLENLSLFWFRNVTITTGGFGQSLFTINPSGEDFVLFIKSFSTSRNSSRDVYSDVYIEVRSLEQLPVFELEFSNKNIDQDIFYEIGRTYDIDANGNHLGFDEFDVDQTDIVPAELILPVFNCFAWGNAVESYKVKDQFNAKEMRIDSRPSGTVENYRENRRISGINYSEPYDQTTGYNGLNEFNLSRINFKDLDDQFGSIQRLYGKNDELMAFQEDKTARIPYQKDILFDADGNGSVRQSTEVLGTEILVPGIIGISKDPESFAVEGNRIYHTDSKRGKLMRYSLDGYTDISRKGMKNWFQDVFRAIGNAKKIGAFDIRYGLYVLHLDDVIKSIVPSFKCGSEIKQFNSEGVYVVDFIMGTESTEVFVNYEINGTVNLSIEEGANTISVGDITGSGSYSFFKTLPQTTTLRLTVTPVTDKPSYSFNIPCQLK